MGRLTVRLIQGRNLAIRDTCTRSSDPYVIFQMKSGGPSFRSKTIFKNLNPIWGDEVFHFSVNEQNDVLEAKCFDQDTLTKDDPLGHFTISISSLPKGQIVDKWYKLENIECGEINLVLTLDSETPTPNPYKVHFNSLAGSLTSEAGSLEKYPTYEIGIFHVKTIFQNNFQGWNEKYDNAIKIFGSGPKAAVVRGVIHVQHAELYRDGISSSRTKSGSLLTGEDFLKLINYGVRNEIRRFYTYVLLDDKLHFSETGAAFFKDFMSKHATHADCSTHVRYAGEFHIQENNGKYKLVIDNNSGTYSPNKDLLPLLANVVSSNFPGLEVEALDFSDPRLKAYRQAIEEHKHAIQAKRGKSSSGLLRLSPSTTSQQPLI